MRSTRALAAAAVMVAAVGMAAPAASASTHHRSEITAMADVGVDGRAATSTAHGGVRDGRRTGATHADMAIGGVLVASALIGGGVFWTRRRAEGKG
jgi:hypothetical protein